MKEETAAKPRDLTPKFYRIAYGAFVLLSRAY
jgi:hypothetical protein